MYDIPTFAKCLLHALCFDNAEMLLSPLWFFTALFGANIITFFLHKCKPYLWAIISISLGIIGLANVYADGMAASYNFKNGLNVILVAQLICYCGYQLKQVNTACLWNKYLQPVLTVVSAVYLVAAKLFWDLSVDMRINKYEPVYLWILAACCGIYMTFSIARYLNKSEILSKLFAYIGNKSIWIFVLHIFCFKLVGLVQVHCFGYDASLLPYWNNVSTAGWWALAYIVVGMGLPLCISFLFNSVKSLRK